jgi:2-methylisocitrate lyase-like PEP mutase family enzyme
LIEAAGFPAVYIGSYATAASRFGLPDVGALSLDELVAQAKTVCDAVDIPVLADAEGGFHHPANMWRTVRAFEDAGVCAIHIEDHAFGKHADVPQRLLTLEKTVARLRAAFEARRDKDFLIVGRTDAHWALGDTEEAIRRANAFTDIGCDLVFLTGFTPSLLKANRARIKGRVMLVDTPGEPVAAEREAGASVVLYYGFGLLAAYASVKQALEEFKRTQNADHVRAATLDLERFLGYAHFAAQARRYKDG